MTRRSAGYVLVLGLMLLAASAPSGALAQPAPDVCTDLGAFGELADQPEPTEVGPSVLPEPAAETERAVPGAAIPGAAAAPPFGAFPEGGQLAALANGNVIAGPGQHQSGCPVSRTTLHYETSVRRMTITVQNLGDCKLTVYAGGRKIELPGLRAGFTSGSLTVETDRFEYECSQGRLCRFLWVVRG